MNQQRQAESGFDRVDQAGVPQGYVEYLDAQHATGFTRQYKQRTIELLTLQPASKSSTLVTDHLHWRDQPLWTLLPRADLVHHSGANANVIVR